MKTRWYISDGRWTVKCDILEQLNENELGITVYKVFGEINYGSNGMIVLRAISTAGGFDLDSLAIVLVSEGMSELRGEPFQ